MSLWASRVSASGPSALRREEQESPRPLLSTRKNAIVHTSVCGVKVLGVIMRMKGVTMRGVDCTAVILQLSIRSGGGCCGRLLTMSHVVIRTTLADRDPRACVCQARHAPRAGSALDATVTLRACDRDVPGPVYRLAALMGSVGIGYAALAASACAAWPCGASRVRRGRGPPGRGRRPETSGITRISPGTSAGSVMFKIV